MSKTTEGKCLFCGKTLSKLSIKKHLDKCNKRAEEYITEDVEKSERYFCILVQGYENPEYWIYIDMPSKSTLRVLDEFLRGIWLECCGHLSLFEIDGQTFSSHPDREFGDRSMSTKLENILGMGMQFKYEYDFGSTTTLKLKIVSEFNGKKRRKKVKLLARNDQPDIKCSYCEKPAINVCCLCIYDGNGWVCHDCADKHECGEEMLLPVVNSPRVGVCAYSGGFYD
jgi:transcription elongation factor Elf1